MLLTVRVPKLVETEDTIELVSWYVKDMDLVKEGAALCLLETSKAAFEVPAEKSGYVKLLKDEGDSVAVEEAICLLADSLEELD